LANDHEIHHQSIIRHKSSILSHPHATRAFHLPIDQLTDGWTNGRTDGWNDGWMDVLCGFDLIFFFQICRIPPEIREESECENN